MTEMLESKAANRPDRHEVVGGMNWFDALRWMPREFRDWVANDAMRLEEINDDKGLTIKAEIPGVDPVTDIDVSIVDGQLQIEARRRETKDERTDGFRRSEFRYGDFYRRLPLPKGAKSERVGATYEKGILTIVVPVDGATESRVTVVPVTSASS